MSRVHWHRAGLRANLRRMATRVQAFTRDGVGGNAAGVVLDARLGAEAMQRIAHELGYSETAFVEPVDAETRVRFFTPTAEVPLCGHATIASWHLLRERGHVADGPHRMATAAGPQRIRIAAGAVHMTQNAPTFGATLPAEQVAPVLGLEPADLVQPTQTASTGLWKIFAVVRDRATLARVRPDLEAIDALARSVGAIGIYVVTLDAPAGATLVARNFAPVVGIAEDAATGTSAAAVSCLLRARSEVGDTVVVHQGDAIGQPSTLLVDLHDGVWVGGRATTAQEHG